MRLAVLTKTVHFEAAHCLLEVSVRGPIKAAPEASDDGMVLDFGELSACVQEAVLRPLDHQNLNDVLSIRTTAENLAHWIWEALVKSGVPDALLYRIRVWETETSSVELTHAEREGETP